jgi:hypothetical protein
MRVIFFKCNNFSGLNISLFGSEKELILLSPAGEVITNLGTRCKEFI